jgi:hypothetical protein
MYYHFLRNDGTRQHTSMILPYTTTVTDSHLLSGLIIFHIVPFAAAPVVLLSLLTFYIYIFLEVSLPSYLPSLFFYFSTSVCGCCLHAVNPAICTIQLVHHAYHLCSSREIVDAPDAGTLS